jgi:hypothetical protein
MWLFHLALNLLPDITVVQIGKTGVLSGYFD